MNWANHWAGGKEAQAAMSLRSGEMVENRGWKILDLFEVFPFETLEKLVDPATKSPKSPNAKSPSTKPYGGFGLSQAINQSTETLRARCYRQASRGEVPRPVSWWGGCWKQSGCGASQIAMHPKLEFQGSRPRYHPNFLNNLKKSLKPPPKMALNGLKWP